MGEITAKRWKSIGEKLSSFRTAWLDADYSPKSPEPAPQNDLWNDRPGATKPRIVAPASSSARTAGGAPPALDWLWQVGGDESESVRPIADDFHLPDYQAYQRPQLAPEQSVSPRRRPNWLAREVALSLDVRPHDRSRVEARLATCLVGPRAHLAAQRLKALIAEGATADSLLGAVELKAAWAERVEFWLYRSPAGWISHISNGYGYLSWRAAHEIAVARSDYWPEEMIDPEWLEEWRQLSVGSVGYQTFHAYAEFRARLEADGRPGWRCEEDQLWRARARAQTLDPLLAFQRRSLLGQGLLL